jgi:hypothetical protein
VLVRLADTTPQRVTPLYDLVPFHFGLLTAAAWKAVRQQLLHGLCLCDPGEVGSGQEEKGKVISLGNNQQLHSCTGLHVSCLKQCSASCLTNNTPKLCNSAFKARQYSSTTSRLGQ